MQSADNSSNPPEKVQSESNEKSPSESSTPEFIWKFGYGSNMSVSFMRDKKSVPVLEDYPAVLKGWALCFNMGMNRFSEPAFANIVEAKDDVVHGLLVKMTKEAAEKLDKEEGGNSFYELVNVEVDTYSGKKITAQVYVGKKKTPSSFHIYPSKRYLGVMIRGAIESGLDPDYIELLERHQYYVPPTRVLKKRKLLPNPSELPKMDIAELKKFNGEPEGAPCYSSICGYIFDYKGMKVVRGRDTTFRRLLHYRGESMDKYDDGGVKPFPKLSQVTPDELEFLKQHMDQYIDQGKVVAVLKEFWEDQEDNAKL